MLWRIILAFLVLYSLGMIAFQGLGLSILLLLSLVALLLDIIGEADQRWSRDSRRTGL